MGGKLRWLYEIPSISAEMIGYQVIEDITHLKKLEESPIASSVTSPRDRKYCRPIYLDVFVARYVIMFELEYSGFSVQEL